MKKFNKLLVFLLVCILAIVHWYPALASYAEEDENYDTGDYENSSEYEDEIGDSTVDPLGGYKGLVAHWKFDGDLKDSSQYNNDGVAIGGKQGVTFVDGVLNSGVRLDGKSYIEVKDSDSLDLMNAFTFSFWVYKEDMRKKDMMDGGVPYIIKNNEEYADFPYGVYEWRDLTPGITFCDEDGADDIHSEKQVDIQKWTLITATYDGKTMKIYQNKQLVKSELKNVALIRSSQPLYIGFGHFMTFDNFFKGILDDMRIYNTALTYSDIEELYDTATASDNPGAAKINKPNALVAYYKLNGDLKDSSGFKNDGIAVNSKGGIKYDYAYAGKGAIFNGASYIEVKDSDSLDIDKGFTISAWIYAENPKTSQPIIAKYGESHDKKNPSYILQDWYGHETLTLANFEEEGDIREFNIDESATMYGRWYYYTVTYHGKEDDEEASKGDNTIKTYINGKLVSTQEFDGDISNSSGPLWIGAEKNNGTFFKGKMDEIRIYNYALSTKEIKRDMSVKDTLLIENNELSKLELNQITKLKVSRRNVNDGKNYDVTDKSGFKTSNVKVLTVKNNEVKAVGKGKAYISIQHGLISAKTNTIDIK